uniref:hypothetical protein n=1 Tax=Neorhizobium sp. EC2-8 TaxID=3129230 RepID=UPI003100C660
MMAANDARTTVKAPAWNWEWNPNTIISLLTLVGMLPARSCSRFFPDTVNLSISFAA